MVTINTSNTLLANLSPEDQGSENDTSGVENIFASMFSILNEDNSSDSKNPDYSELSDAMVIMEQIKNDLIKKNTSSSNELLENANGHAWTTNVLKIYESYKSLIEDSLNLGKEPTVKFNLGLKSHLVDENSTIDSVRLNNLDSVEDLNNNKFINRIGNSNSTDHTISFTEFSKAELDKLKAKLKQAREIPTGLTQGEKKESEKSNAKKPLEGNQTIGKSLDELKLEKVKNDGLTTNFVKKSLSASTNSDGSKAEISSDSNSNLTKPESLGKSTVSEHKAQNGQNSMETHLKLLQKSWGKDLAKIIEKAIADGKEKIEISLDPRRLGKMSLTLSVSNNQTSIAINTESAAASLILSGSEERLGQMFESSGLKLSNFQANSNSENSNKNGSKSKNNNDTKTIKGADGKNSKSTETEAVSYDSNGRKIVNLIA